MTNHKEEQELEIEALESIFEDGKELNKISETEFTLKLMPDPTGAEVNHVQVTLHITYTPDYPDAAPEWALEEMDSLPEPKQIVLKGKLEEVVESSLGMAMVYSMAETCQDYLKENNVKALSMHEEMMQRLAKEGGGGEEEEEDEEGDDDDEGANPEDEWKGLAEKALCKESDRITTDAFTAWKIKFDEEMIATGVLKRVTEKGQTGKMFFLAAQAKESADNSSKNVGDASSTPLVYDASLFGEMDDDLDDLSGDDD